MKSEYGSNQGLLTELNLLKQEISALKKSESACREQVEALLKSKEFFREISLNSSDIVLVTDRNGMFIYASPSLERFLGYKPSEIIGMRGFDFILPEDLARAFDDYAKAVVTNEIIPNAFRVRHKDGSERFLEGVGSNFLDHPSVNGFVMNVRDVTERRQTEEKLRESEKRLADIVDFLPDATFAIDREGRIIAWNRAIEGLTGKAAGDMIGKGDFEYAVPFYGERRPILIDLALQRDEEIEQRYVFVRQDGDIFIAETSAPMAHGSSRYLWGKARPLFDGNGRIAGAIESIRDITDQTRAEEALRESEEKFSLVFHSNPALMAISTMEDGRFVDVNQAFLKILGYERNEVIGKTSVELNIPDAACRSEIVRAIKENDPVRNLEISVETKGGDVRTGLINADRIELSSGRYLLSVASDLTDLINVQQEKEHLREQLRRSQQMEAVATLAGGIAHDFNNIIGAVSGYTEMIMAYVKKEDKIYSYLKTVSSAAERAKELVRQLLAFSDQTKRDFRPVRVSLIAADALRLLETTLPGNIHARLENSAERDIVKGDPAQIHRAFMNLCDNAVHAMKGYGGVLEIALCCRTGGDHEGAIRPSSLPEGRYLEIAVKDTGAGIEARDMDRIFDPFFTTKTPSQGTGMGLPVVYGTVKNHGGAVTVESEVGKGTTVRVYLPILDDPEAA